jgi:hypothetical protein
MYKISWCENEEPFVCFEWFDNIIEAAKFVEQKSKDCVIEIKYEDCNNNGSTLRCEERFTTLP